MTNFKRQLPEIKTIRWVKDNTIETPINRPKTKGHFKKPHLNREVSDLHTIFSVGYFDHETRYPLVGTYEVKAPAYVEDGEVVVPAGVYQRMDKNHTVVAIEEGRLTEVDEETEALIIPFKIEDMAGLRDLYRGHDSKDAVETVAQATHADKIVTGLSAYNPLVASLFEATSLKLLIRSYDKGDNTSVMIRYKPQATLINEFNLGVPQDIKLDSLKLETEEIDKKGKKVKKKLFPSAFKAAMLETVRKHKYRALHVWKNYIIDPHREQEIRDIMLGMKTGTNENRLAYDDVLEVFENKFNL